MSEEHSDKKRKKQSSSDADELREIADALPQLLGAINESVPKLIKGLIGSVYSPESAGEMAKGIGQFYSNLIAEGIPEDVALDMTKKFVGALDFEGIMKMVNIDSSAPSRKRRKSHNYHDDEDIEDAEFE
ncbi:hypothetical protein EU545_05550 [Candidatus Thorarchaeota archaeon]|jgi:hypothetical protein|nr:MAG: hypothetical protein EU545_05550 [Candidatus Thorarchaeota archaeon]